MNTNDIFEIYHETALIHCEKWGVDDPHVVKICQSVMMDRDDFLQGGSFVQCVNKNNLTNAVLSADPTCLKFIKIIVLSRNVYLEENVYNEISNLRTGISR
jgi:hypothetical protein